jgi:CheY-like chemotaxis protein/anti-sigma regulatory factor (Ser/Thr protein kinase)
MAEESDRLKSAFLSNMSHEIRTPLNAISGFSCLLSDPDITKKDRGDFIQRITNGCDTLLNLINNILDLAKLEAGIIKLNKRKCLLNNLLETIHSLHSNSMEKIRKSRLSLDLLRASSEKDLTILADPDRIFQVLSNLLDNALKFTENGSINFGCEIKDDQLMFFVRDTGPGLNAEQKKIIFERFRKAEEAKTKLYGGAGLGLAICKKLVQLMDGDIWMESEPGRGTSFFFTIPFIPAAVEKKAGMKEEPPVHKRSLKGKKVLVAEDNQLNYKLIEAYLAGTDLEIAWARDGKEALDYYRSSDDVDMVLMDLRMPVMDGFQATEQIRSFNKDIPVVAVSAHSIREEQAKAESSGFTDYLTKPVSQEVLLQTIHKYIFNR